MKMMSLAFFLMIGVLGARPAAAQLVYYEMVSTATYTTVQVSNSAATRVDNLTQGNTYVLPNRNKILLTVLSTGGAKVNCGYDSNVTSDTSKTGGAEYASGSTVAVFLSTAMSYWCKAQGSASQAVAVQQTSPWKPGTRSIPGSP